MSIIPSLIFFSHTLREEKAWPAWLWQSSCNDNELHQAPPLKAVCRHYCHFYPLGRVRLYGLLFKHKNAEDVNEVPGGFLTDINPNSKMVLKSYADRFLSSVKVYDKYQFERIGFLSVENNVIFRRKATLCSLLQLTDLQNSRNFADANAHCFDHFDCTWFTAFTKPTEAT
ncbi:hypothetical protein GQX74_014469 [Glossina fuscipes]|nr:hypothetical protein GQX74_014469 [Glossina fuscipes]